MTAPVLVTGGTGYLATRLTADLLLAGTPVRTTIRSAVRADAVRTAVRRAGADDGGLDFAVATLTEDAGWAEAAAGAEEVHHVASPLVHSGTPDEIVPPARDGALRLLRAARDAGARRVVLTSSFAAVGYTPKPVGDYDEDDWTDPDTPGLPAYPMSKAVAERAAWDFVQREGGGLELVALNPTWIAGPTVTVDARSSLQLFTAMLDGTMPAARKQLFGVADVRDVSAMHRAAMATQQAAGHRYLLCAAGPLWTFLRVASVLRDRLGDAASAAPTTEEPGPDPTPLTIRTDRAKRDLGFAPRPAEQTVADTVDSMRDLGMVPAAG